jgi:lipooligosaccharide transport system permease protein
MRTRYWQAPDTSARFVQVWRRNFLVWRKLTVPSLLGNHADPMIYMLGFGYGLGAFLPQIDGVSYIAFLAAGTICFSTMNSASFEALYSGFSRMHVQRTWDAIMNAPVSLDDVVLAEAVWAASKSFLSGVAILAVAWGLGLCSSPLALWIIPLTFLIGFAFASMGLIVTALSSSFDFFMYYFTLVITPMAMLCGVFYPISQLPQLFQDVAAVLPLSHAVELVRPLLLAQRPEHVLLHLAVLAGYGIVSFYAALVLMRRRLLK